MARNREPFAAPPALMQMSKATLADLVWEFAAHVAEEGVDDLESRRKAIVERTAFVQAPRSDIRIAERLLRLPDLGPGRSWGDRS